LLPISQPVKSAKYANIGNDPTAAASAAAISATATTSTNGQPQMHAKHDLVVWFEVLELGKQFFLF
jgi:hypothetical protein